MYRFEHDDCYFSQNKSQGLEVELLVITQHLKKSLDKKSSILKIARIKQVLSTYCKE